VSNQLTFTLFFLAPIGAFALLFAVVHLVYAFSTGGEEHL